MDATIQLMNKYMFSPENMKQNNNYRYNFKNKGKTSDYAKHNDTKNDNGKNNESKIEIKKQVLPETFIPSQKDKLFWCFYIILYGYEEYEINKTSSFTVEQKIKIETVEGLKQIKDQIKDIKLKRTELEEELVSKQTISLKGLTALCILHNVSITYVYGRKYCIINPAINDLTKIGVILQNKKKEDAIKWIKNDNIHENDTNNDINNYLNTVKEEYWLIENIQKPLKSPASYSSPELHDICKKLEIDTQIKNEMTGKQKSKTKKQLYDEILQFI